MWSDYLPPDFLAAFEGETGIKVNYTTVPYEKALGGDTTAMIFWLKNRKPEQWREKQEIAHSGGFDIVVDVVEDGD